MPCVRIPSSKERRGSSRLTKPPAQPILKVSDVYPIPPASRGQFSAHRTASYCSTHFDDYNAHRVQRKRKFGFSSRAAFSSGARAAGLDAGRARPEGACRQTHDRHARIWGMPHPTAQGAGRSGRSGSWRHQVLLQRRRRGQLDRRQCSPRCRSRPRTPRRSPRRDASDENQRSPSCRRMSCQGSTRSAAANRSRLSIERFLRPRSTPLI